MTTLYTPEQNDISECKNQIVVEMTRSLFKGKHLLNQFWAEADATTICLLNILPIKVVINQTPFETWYDMKPSVSYLKFFTRIVYALMNS